MNIHWLDAETIGKSSEPEKILSGYQGILIPGGFGEQGFEGMIKTVRFARENGIPYLGLCYGMQIAVCEFARNVCGLREASTTEIHPDTPHPVITIIESQKDTLAREGYGGTMRLGGYAAILSPDTFIYNLYDKTGRIALDREKVTRFSTDKNQHFRLGKLDTSGAVIVERHRHRYEVNPEYSDKLTEKGLVFSGYHIREDNTRLMEFMEIPGHPCFIGTQGHPEFTSRLGRPNPLFLGFVRAMSENKR